MNILTDLAIQAFNRLEGSLYEEDVGGIETAPPTGFEGFNHAAYQRYVGPFMRKTMNEAADRFGLGDLGRYAGSVIGENGYHGLDKGRGERFLERIAGRLGYRVEYVPGTGIDAKGNLGATYFGNNDFDRVIYVARDLSNDERGYVAMHEAFEAMEKARNPGYNPEYAEQHNALELKVLDYMDKHGYKDELDAALNMHMKRFGGYNKGTFMGIEEEIRHMHAKFNDTEGTYRTGSLDKIFAGPKNYVTGRVHDLLNTRGLN